MDRVKWAAVSGRGAIVLGVLSLIGAWTATQSGSLFGLTEVHLFSDAIVFSLLGIAGLIDAQLHKKGI